MVRACGRRLCLDQTQLTRRPKGRLLCMLPRTQLFYSFFKTLVGKTVIVELKNELCIQGTLHSVDQYLNVKLLNITVLDEAKYPHMVRHHH